MKNAIDSAKVFLQRGVSILEKNELWHQEAVQKFASLEAEIAKWRAAAQTLW